MDISEVAKRSGVPASTLRYYEEKGLIASVGRQGLRRLFLPAVLDQPEGEAAEGGERRAKARGGVPGG